MQHNPKPGQKQPASEHSLKSSTESQKKQEISQKMEPSKKANQKLHSQDLKRTASQQALQEQNQSNSRGPSPQHAKDSQPSFYPSEKSSHGITTKKVYSKIDTGISKTAGTLKQSTFDLSDRQQSKPLNTTQKPSSRHLMKSPSQQLVKSVGQPTSKEQSRNPSPCRQSQQEVEKDSINAPRNLISKKKISETQSNKNDDLLLEYENNSLQTLESSHGITTKKVYSKIDTGISKIPGTLKQATFDLQERPQSKHLITTQKPSSRNLIKSPSEQLIKQVGQSNSKQQSRNNSPCIQNCQELEKDFINISKNLISEEKMQETQNHDNNDREYENNSPQLLDSAHNLPSCNEDSQNASELKYETKDEIYYGDNYGKEKITYKKPTIKVTCPDDISEQSPLYVQINISTNVSPLQQIAQQEDYLLDEIDKDQNENQHNQNNHSCEEHSEQNQVQDSDFIRRENSQVTEESGIVHQQNDNNIDPIINSEKNQDNDDLENNLSIDEDINVEDNSFLMKQQQNQDQQILEQEQSNIPVENSCNQSKIQGTQNECSQQLYLNNEEEVAEILVLDNSVFDLNSLKQQFDKIHQTILESENPILESANQIPQQQDLILNDKSPIIEKEFTLPGTESISVKENEQSYQQIQDSPKIQHQVGECKLQDSKEEISPTQEKIQEEQLENVKEYYKKEDHGTQIKQQIEDSLQEDSCVQQDEQRDFYKQDNINNNISQQISKMTDNYQQTNETTALNKQLAQILREEAQNEIQFRLRTIEEEAEIDRLQTENFETQSSNSESKLAQQYSEMDKQKEKCNMQKDDEMDKAESQNFIKEINQHGFNEQLDQFDEQSNRNLKINFENEAGILIVEENREDNPTSGFNNPGCVSGWEFQQQTDLKHQQIYIEQFEISNQRQFQEQNYSNEMQDQNYVDEIDKEQYISVLEEENELFYQDEQQLGNELLKNNRILPKQSSRIESQNQENQFSEHKEYLRENVDIDNLENNNSPQSMESMISHEIIDEADHEQEYSQQKTIGTLTGKLQQQLNENDENNNQLQNDEARINERESQNLYICNPSNKKSQDSQDQLMSRKSSSNDEQQQNGIFRLSPNSHFFSKTTSIKEIPKLKLHQFNQHKIEKDQDRADTGRTVESIINKIGQQSESGLDSNPISSDQPKSLQLMNNHQIGNQMKKKPQPLELLFDIEESGTPEQQARSINPTPKPIDSQKHTKNTMSFGLEQPNNQDFLKRDCVIQYNQPQLQQQLNEEKVEVDLKKLQRLKEKEIEKKQKEILKKKISQEKQDQKEREKNLLLEKRRKEDEYKSRIMELEKSLQLAIEQDKQKEEVLKEQKQKINSFIDRIDSIQEIEDEGDFYQVGELISDHQDKMYELISNLKLNHPLVNALKEKYMLLFKQRYRYEHEQYSQACQTDQIEFDIKQALTISPIRLILQELFSKIMELRTISHKVGLNIAQTNNKIYNDIHSLSKSEQFKARITELNECLKYEIIELRRYIENENQEVCITDIEEILHSDLLVQDKIHVTLLNLNNIYKERLNQIKEGDEKMYLSLKLKQSK